MEDRFSLKLALRRLLVSENASQRQENTLRVEKYKGERRIENRRV